MQIGKRRGQEGQPQELGLAQLGHMYVVRHARATHVQGSRRACAAQHPEVNKELLRPVKVGHAHPHVGNVKDFDQRHD